MLLLARFQLFWMASQGVRDAFFLDGQASVHAMEKGFDNHVQVRVNSSFIDNEKLGLHVLFTNVFDNLKLVLGDVAT